MRSYAQALTISRVPGWIPAFVLAVAPVAGAVSAEAQDPRQPEALTVQEAVRIGLEHNHGVRVVRNLHEIDGLQRSAAAAAFLPSVHVSVSQFFNTEQTWAGETAPLENERIGFDLLEAEVGVRWTLFDGFRSFATRRRFSALERLGEARLDLEVEHTVREIVLAYHTIAREERLLSVLEDAVRFSEERLRIAETMRELGAFAEYDVILARSDLNTDRAAVLRQEADLARARLSFAQLLGSGDRREFRLDPDIPLSEPLQREEVERAARERNRELHAAAHREEAAELARSEVHRERFPTVSLAVGYEMAREAPRYGPIGFERARGFQLGLQTSLPLFDGFERRRRAEIAEVELANRRIELEETELWVERTVRSTFIEYETARSLVEIEAENLGLAVEALDIALEQFQVSSITSTELREAQRVVLDAETRLLEARFAAQAAETELLRLSGGLGARFGF